MHRLSRGVRAPCAIVLVVALAALSVGAAGARSEESAVDRWWRTAREKNWVTAFADSSRRSAIPAPVDLIVVLRGSSRQVVYRAGADDVEISDPVVSPDGTRLAFVKREGDPRRIQAWLYAMDVDGRNMTRLAFLAHGRGLTIKGARTAPTRLAWSHDSRTLAMLETIEADYLRYLAPGDDRYPGNMLRRLDVATGTLTDLVVVERRGWGEGAWGSAITSQAWAPDGRRLVYMNNDGRITVLDTISRQEVDLGVGSEPTWSPDGRWIAVKEPRPRDSRRRTSNGDYFLVAAEPPHERVLLLSNPRPWPARWWRPDYYILGYFDPMTWFPDARYLTVQHNRGEDSDRYLLDRATGEVGRMPAGTWGGYGWGGTLTSPPISDRARTAG
jgi:dipeptidyl aminopeptidase/acylaminoacyl peptidase